MSDLAELASELLEELRKRNLTLASAESCTGGWIGRELTAVAGSSDVYAGGVISYSNELKMKFLKVRKETLDSVGAVSKECCREMTEGICRETGARAGIAVTGIAGPGGGTPEKPVGLVWTGLSLCGKTVISENHFSGNREEVRRSTVRQVLAALLAMVKELPC